MYDEMVRPTQAEEAEYYNKLAQSEQQSNYENNKKIEKMNQPKLTKVKSVQANGTFESNFGTDLGNGKKGFYKFEYQMEDGATVNANHKKEVPFQQGDQVEYLITKPEYNGGNVSKPSDNSYQSNGAPKSNYQNNNKSANASYALSYSKDVYVARGGSIEDDSPVNVAGYITGLADELLKWLNENSK